MHKDPFAFVGESGFEFVVDADREVEEVTNAVLRVRKPGGTITDVPAQVDSSCTTHWKATCPAGLLSEQGTYRAQLRLTTTAGTLIGSREEFEVAPAIEDPS